MKHHVPDGKGTPEKIKKTLQCSTVHRNGLINNYDCSLELLKTHHSGGRKAKVKL